MSKVYGTSASEDVRCVNLTVDGRAVFNGEVDLSAEFVGETLTDGKLNGTTTLQSGHVFTGTLNTDSTVRFGSVLSPFILQKGDSSTPPVLTSTQIQFGFNGSDDYAHFISTEHYGGLSANNEIKFWTCNGTQVSNFPSTVDLGLTITEGGIKVPNFIQTDGDVDVAGTLTAQGGTDIIQRQFINTTSSIDLSNEADVPSRMFVTFKQSLGAITLTINIYRGILKPFEIVVCDHPGNGAGNTINVKTFSDTGLSVPSNNVYTLGNDTVGNTYTDTTGATNGQYIIRSFPTPASTTDIIVQKI